MKRAYAASKYAKPCERYCRETYPEEAEQICRKAEAYYLDFMQDMPDLGENMMAKNMLDWFTILAFYEASGHRMDGETLLEIIDHYQAADYLDLLEALQGDFGNIDVCSYEYKGEVVGVFSEKSLYRRSMDLLDQTVADQLFDPERPILTKAHDVPPSRYATGSHACNSIISAGCIIKGTVRNSILSRGVVVEEGASVTNSIINQSCIIKSGARVENAILDKNNVVPTNTELRGTPENILVLGKAPLTSDTTIVR